MVDNLTFQMFNPIDKELRADDEKVTKAIKIFVNGLNLCDILKKIELPYLKKDEKYLSYGHLEPKRLHSYLTTAMDSNIPAPLFCCPECGEACCWSVEVFIRHDEKYVYWKKFEHSHRDEWKYNLSFKFNRQQYEIQLDSLLTI